LILPGWEISVDVLLVSDDPDFESVLPTLSLLATTLRTAPVHDGAAAADVAMVDARTDLVAARKICRQLAGTDVGVGVVAVMGRGGGVAVDLDWGIDEVVLAGAEPDELHTRLRLAVSRRRRTLDQRGGPVVRFGDLVIDEASYTAALGDRCLDLTLTEFKLLNYLVQRQGRAVSRAELLHQVWGWDDDDRGDIHTVNVHMHRLRAKLGDQHRPLIDTVRGVGYMAVPSPQHRPRHHLRAAG
jgi:DNA-binding response OmpR family regulator